MFWQISLITTLYKLVNKINWPFFEDAFKKHYSVIEQPAESIILIRQLFIRCVTLIVGQLMAVLLKSTAGDQL
jgi:hypothetical protein